MLVEAATLDVGPAAVDEETAAAVVELPTVVGPQSHVTQLDDVSEGSFFSLPPKASVVAFTMHQGWLKNKVEHSSCRKTP